MVSPLFIEIFGGVIALTLFWVLPIYFSRKKEKELVKQKLDKKHYKKALKDYKNNPNDKGTWEAVWYLGHIYYSHQYPDEAKYPFLELALNRPELPTAAQVRNDLISKDLKKRKVKKAA